MRVAADGDGEESPDLWPASVNFTTAVAPLVIYSYYLRTYAEFFRRVAGNVHALSLFSLLPGQGFKKGGGDGRTMAVLAGDGMALQVRAATSQLLCWGGVL